MPEEARVYFIGSPIMRAIKIGHTQTHPQARRSQLQAGTPDKLVVLGSIPGELKDETLLHRRFSDLRIRGEWFAAGEQLLNFIEQQCNVDLSGWRNTPFPVDEMTAAAELLFAVKRRAAQKIMASAKRKAGRIESQASIQAYCSYWNRQNRDSYGKLNKDAPAEYMERLFACGFTRLEAERLMLVKYATRGDGPTLAKETILRWAEANLGV